MRERFSGPTRSTTSTCCVTHCVAPMLRWPAMWRARPSPWRGVAWRRMEQIPAEPLPWLYGVARRVLANELRGQHRRDRLTSRLELAASAAGVPTVQPDHAVEVTTSAYIRATMAKLSPRTRKSSN